MPNVAVCSSQVADACSLVLLAVMTPEAFVAQTLQDQLEEAKREMKSIRQKKRRLETAGKKILQDTLKWLRVLWQLSAGNADLMRCAWKVEKERLQNVWDPSEVSTEDIWNSVGQDIELSRLTCVDMVFLLEPDNKADQILWLKAWIFFAEWRVAHAVRSLNVDKHLVASSEYVMGRYHRFLLQEHPCRPRCIHAMAEEKTPLRNKPEAQRQWLCRWRQRWGCLYKKMPNRKLMLDHKICEKVTPKVCPISVTFCMTKLGHVFRVQI